MPVLGIVKNNLTPIEKTIQFSKHSISYLVISMYYQKDKVILIFNTNNIQLNKISDISNLIYIHDKIQ